MIGSGPEEGGFGPLGLDFCSAEAHMVTKIGPAAARAIPKQPMNSIVRLNISTTQAARDLLRS
jgi:hypothetical protein